MLDLGWQEFVLVAIVLILVVGPKDMPRVLKASVKTIGKLRGMAREFQTSMMEVADQEEFRDVKKTFNEIRTGELEEIKESMGNNYVPGFSSEVNEIKSAANELKSEVEATQRSASKAASKPAKKAARKVARKAAKKKAAKKSAQKSS
jgi:sec-independent protein translocase protein TatB